MRPGVWRRKTHMFSSIIRKPTTNPMSGASTMKTPILTSPLATSEPNPALATAAPAKPPMSACDDEVGNPHPQVTRSQAMAPTRPARITHWSTRSARTTPLPTVLATCTPKPNAATKLKKAAHTTACSGVSTRVDTTVAIELAASWKPLMKSKIRATRTMKTTMESTGRSRHLEDDPLDHVDDVLTPVGDDLHRLVDLFPLDHLDGIALLLEQRRQTVAQEIVGTVLEPVDLHRVLVEAGVHRAQALDGPVHGVRLLHDHLGHGPRGRGRLLDAVHHEALGGGLDVVEHVVEPGGEVVDVLAVDRRDERGVQPLDDLVRDLVALMLDFLDRVGLGASVSEVVELLAQKLGSVDDVLRLLLEQVEEQHLARNEPEHPDRECNGDVTIAPAQPLELAQRERRQPPQRSAGQRPDGRQRVGQRRR